MSKEKLKTVNTTENLSTEQLARIQAAEISRYQARDAAQKILNDAQTKAQNIVQAATADLDRVCVEVARELGVDLNKKLFDLPSKSFVYRQQQ